MIGKVGRDMSQMGAASMKQLGWACCTRGPVPVLYHIGTTKTVAHSECFKHLW